MVVLVVVGLGRWLKCGDLVGGWTDGLLTTADLFDLRIGAVEEERRLVAAIFLIEMVGVERLLTCEFLLHLSAPVEPL